MLPCISSQTQLRLKHIDSEHCRGYACSLAEATSLSLILAPDEFVRPLERLSRLLLPSLCVFFLDLSLDFFDEGFTLTSVLPTARPLLPGHGWPVLWSPGNRTNSDSMAAFPSRQVSTPT